MIVSVLGLLAAFSVQAPAQVAATTYVVSILNDRAGDDVSLRFVLSGPPGSYSATREGDDILVRIAAEALPGLRIPLALDPIRSLALGSDPGFTLRVTLIENQTHEMVRETSSLRLIIRKRAATEALPAAAPSPTIMPEPAAIPSPSPERSPNRAGEPVASDTADLYRRLFPSTLDPTAAAAVGQTEVGGEGNWYSNFTWLGLQARPWVSVSYVDGKTTQPASNQVTVDSYWVIQPNLGFGFSPGFGGGRGGQWTVNYSPRFRRGVDLELPHLTSHFFDIGVDQPIGTSSAVYGNYHFSTGVLETEEIDPGREYGIGLNRVGDTSLERFQRNSFGFGVRFDAFADTQVDVNVNKNKVRFGDGPENPPPGGRAFFDSDTRTLNASLRRGLGESRFLRFLFGVHDAPTQPERQQVEGRGYSYGASVEGEIAALTTGRILFGYRTQKNPNAGVGGRDYKDITYAAQLVRTISDDTTLGLGADRNLYLSAYAENGFYVADAIRGDLTTRLPFALSLRGSAGLQSNNYKASPQVVDPSGARALRKDRIEYWSLGLTRSLAHWAYLRVDYTAERRDSNVNQFDINSRALTFQLSLGYFGRSGNPVPRSW